MMREKIKKNQHLPGVRFTFGLREGEFLAISGVSAVIGRDPNVEIQLDSPFVSRRHAKIVFEDGYWFIEDLYSKNGVFSHTTRIQPGKRVRLNHGDMIQVGSVSAFEFNDPESTMHESALRMILPGLWLDEPKREVFINGQRLEPPLSLQQFDLLFGLFHQDGGVLSNEKIGKVLWPDAAGGIERAAIDNAVSRLRERLAELDQEHEYIETVRGVGRRFVQRNQVV